MQAIHRLHAGELNTGILESIKAQFGDREIEIRVTGTDETGYLMSSPVNKERLLAAIERVEAGEELVVPDQEQFRCGSSHSTPMRSSNTASRRFERKSCFDEFDECSRKRHEIRSKGLGNPNH